jgi:hypothetical protein
MSRSTASPPPERSVLSGGRCRASEADKMSEKPCARVGLFSGALPLSQSVSRTYAAGRGRETNPHSSPLGGALRC